MGNKKNRFCVVIPARNEEKVIGGVLESLFKQDYPNDLFDVYVVPNNCNDNTETVSREHGAKIFNCERPVRYRGDALEQFFEYIISENDIYDAFCMFDADNTVDKNFIKIMNEAYNSGVQVAQGYKGSVNPKETCISGCQAIYFCTWNNLYKRNDSIGMPLSITGPGNMISSDVIRKIGFHTTSITEDIDFSCQCVIEGINLKYIKEAVFYEEHPKTLSIAWAQYRRWFTGCLECKELYGKTLLDLIKHNRKNSAVYYVTQYPLLLATQELVILGLFLVACAVGKIFGINIMVSLFSFLLIAIVLAAIYSIIAIKTNNKKISFVNIFSIFMYWFYLLMRMTCASVSVFKPVKNWKAIIHGN